MWIFADVVLPSYGPVAATSRSVTLLRLMRCLARRSSSKSCLIRSTRRFSAETTRSLFLLAMKPLLIVTNRLIIQQSSRASRALWSGSSRLTDGRHEGAPSKRQRPDKNMPGWAITSDHEF